MSTSTETRPVAVEPSEADVVAIDRLQALHRQLRSELARVIIGQDVVTPEERLQRFRRCLFDS